MFTILAMVSALAAVVTDSQYAPINVAIYILGFGISYLLEQIIENKKGNNV